MHTVMYFRAIFLLVATQDLFDEVSVLRFAAQARTQASELAKPREPVAALRETFNNRKHERTVRKKLRGPNDKEKTRIFGQSKKFEKFTKIFKN